MRELSFENDSDLDEEYKSNVRRALTLMNLPDDKLPAQGSENKSKQYKSRVFNSNNLKAKKNTLIPLKKEIYKRI
jgi:hypothetical protein